MKVRNETDWRLNGYNGHLNNEVFQLQQFKGTVSNDHEHCEFCGKKITDLDIPNEEYVREGYCCLNSKTKQLNWICTECFNAFKDRFNFTQK